MSERTVVAYRAEAQRWARHIGAPADVVRRAAVYEERIPCPESGGVYARVMDEAGDRIWSSGRQPIRPRSRSVTFTMIRERGWDKRGPGGLLAGGAP
jgi:hypothetical protein